ncbi:MAG: hypothetical protein V7686_05025 [Qipengyuania sp.]
MSKILSSHRYRAFHTVRQGAIDGSSERKSSKGVSGWFSIQTQLEDGSSANLIYPALDVDHYRTLGIIVAQWTTFEFIVDLMTEMMLDHLNQDEGQWRKVLGFKSRLNLHKRSFNAIFKSHLKIKQYHKEALFLMVEPKKVRDSIAHQLPVQGRRSDKETIVFMDPGMKLPREKHYTFDALNDLSADMSHATGCLETLAADPEIIRPFSSRDKSALQHVFGHDRWTEATLQALKIQRQS